MKLVLAVALLLQTYRVTIWLEPVNLPMPCPAYKVCI